MYNNNNEKQQEEKITKKKEFSFMNFVNEKEQKKLNTRMVTVYIDELLENENNKYELSEIDSLADSIEILGLLQPLLVKEIKQNQYKIIAGHRRYNAIKKLINEKRLEKDYRIICKEVEEDEMELVTRLKLHETNLQTRSLLKMAEEEKLAVIEDYMDILKQAKEQGLEINGKPVKGKTRNLIAERFNISGGTAQSLVKKIQDKEKSTNFGTLSKTPKNKGSALKSLLKKAKTIDQGLDEEETKIVQEIIEVLEQLR